MRKLLCVLVAVAGCTKADPEPTAAPVHPPAPAVAFAEPPPTTAPPPKAVDVKVELTAVTLADDCSVRAAVSEPRRESAVRTRGDSARESRQRRPCEQTSMQLALSASAVSQIQIKSVELFDEHGTSLGTLAASKPTRWSAATSRYDAWDEALAANSPVNVSYVLSQPNWSKIGNRFNRTYTLKTVVSIGGVDRSVTRDITRTAPTALPANVRT